MRSRAAKAESRAEDQPQTGETDAIWQRLQQASKQAAKAPVRIKVDVTTYTHVVFFFFSALLHQTAHDSVQLSLSDILYARTQTLLSSLVRVTTYISLTVASAAVEWRSFVPPGAYLAFRLRPCDALTRL